MPEPVTEAYNPPRDPTSTTAGTGGQPLSTTTGTERQTPGATDAHAAERQRGRFTIVREHARGGLGKVSLARDDKLGRQVALKEIRPEHGDNPQLRQRFLSEAAITGMLEHPGIVPIYQMDEDAEGRPFYAMRFIQGRTLGEAIRAFHGQAGGIAPFSSREFRGLLQRFTSVCQTIAYAHSRHVIHRDLKPANVMLGDYGETLVVDWGLAKKVGELERASAGAPASEAATSTSPSSSSLTQAGQVLGTPAYMAPEQAAGDLAQVGPATDVYALGALLYELLTGRPPFHDPAPELILYRVVHGEFAPPRRVQAAAPRALEAICLKAMARRVSDRYENADALGRDVDCWLADEPVSTYREPMIVRGRRWARRHRVLVSSAAVLLLTAVLGLTLGLVAVDSERRQTAHERDQKDIALQSEIRAKEAASEARIRTMNAMRKLTDDFVAQQLAGHLQLTDDDRRFLRDIQTQYEEFAALPGDETEQRAIRAEGHYQVGALRLRLGEQQEAESSYLNGLELYRALAADFPRRLEFRVGLARCQQNLGTLLNSTGRLKEAEAAYADALALCQQLTVDFPATPEVRQDLATAQNSVARLFQATGRLKQAEEAYAAGLAVEKQLAADFPARPEFHHGLGRSHDNLGGLLHHTGRFKEAEAAYKDAIVLLAQLVAKFPGRAEYRVDLARGHSNLAVLLQFTGRVKDAEAAYLVAIALRRQLAADFPVMPRFRDDLAKSHRNLGHLLNATGRASESEAAYEAALVLHKQLAADFPAQPDFRRELGADHLHRGNLFWGTGRLKDAETAYKDSLALYQQLVADFPTRPEFRHELAMGQGNLGLLYGNMGRHEQAEAAHADALATYQKLALDFPTRPEFRQGVARIHSELGAVLAATGRPKEAEAAYREAIALRKQLTLDFPARSDFRQELAVSQNDFGSLLAAMERLEEAEAAYGDALAVRRQLAAEFPNMPDARNYLAGTLVNLAGIHYRRGEYSSARILLDEAAPHHQVALQANPRNPTYRQFYRIHLNTMIRSCAGVGDQAAALEAAKKLQEVGWDPPGDAYSAASTLAWCAGLVAKDENAPKEQRDKQTQYYGDQAMAMLRAAVAKGFKNATQLKKDTELDALRSREDFKALLAELDAKGK